MKPESSFIKSELHRKIVNQIITEKIDDPSIIGMLVLGSHARGDAQIASDADLFFILEDGESKDFETKTIDGVLVEYKYADSNKARIRLDTNPMEIYSYLDSRIVFDKRGMVAQLIKEAIEKYHKYSVTLKERQEIYHWLHTAQIKMRSSLQSNDLLKASFVTTATTYKIFEGLWSLNNKPVPPVGSVLAHLKDLGLELPILRSVNDLLLGMTTERINSAIELIDYINQRVLND